MEYNRLDRALNILRLESKESLRDYPILEDICERRIQEIYDNKIPEYVKSRYEKEMNYISKYQFASLYIAARDVIVKAGLKKEDFYVTGNVGNSFVAYLCGLTSINPFEYNLPMEPWYGMAGSKFPNIELVVSEDRLIEVRELIREKGLKLDILRCSGSQIMNMLNRFEKLTNTRCYEEQVEVEEILPVFKMEVENEYGRNFYAMVPQLNQDRFQACLSWLNPKTLSRFADAIALTMGDGLVFPEIEEYIERESPQKINLICTREDLVDMLLSKGASRKYAFSIMDRVRKGKQLTGEQDDYLRFDLGISDEIIEQCYHAIYICPRSASLEIAKKIILLGYYYARYPQTAKTAEYLEWMHEYKAQDSVELYLKRNRIDNLEQLKNNFQVYEILEHLKSGVLRKWLLENGYEEVWDRLGPVIVMEPDQIKRKIYEVFEIPFDSGEEYTISDMLMQEAESNRNWERIHTKSYM